MDYSLIIKLTNNCNLNCSYCYHRKDKNRDFNSALTKDAVGQIIHKILLHNEHEAEFIWHGGEPLLVGLDMFKFIVETQQKMNPKCLNIKNRVQTNGTLLTDEFIQFFIYNKFDIGISIDGPYDMHASKRGTYISEYESILRSLDQLQTTGAHYGILCVVGKQHVGQARRIFNLLNEHGIKNLGFLPCLVQENGNIDESLTISPLEYGKFLIDFFEIWINGNVHGLHIRNFDDCIRYYRNKPAKTCINTNSCDRYLTILPNENIYLCDNFSANDAHKVGSIEAGFDGIEHTEAMQWLKRFMYSVPESCAKCNYYCGCYSGCKYRRWVRDPNMEAGHYYCMSTKMLFNHVGKYLKVKEDE